MNAPTSESTPPFVPIDFIVCPATLKFILIFDPSIFTLNSGPPPLIPPRIDATRPTATAINHLFVKAFLAILLKSSAIFIISAPYYQSYFS